jgi:hypothetical protein
MALAFEGLYLLQTHSCVVLNNNVYKISRSNNIKNRMAQYPNGSIVLFAIESDNSKKHEYELIKLFNSKYKCCNFFGKEYFEGDKHSMINDIKLFIINLIPNPKLLITSFIVMSYNENNKYILPSERDYGIVTNYIMPEIVSNNKDDDAEDAKDAEDNIVKEISINNKAEEKADRKCKICDTVFDYPSLLERHITGKRKCKKIIRNEFLICKYCDEQYSRKYTLLRHMKICKSKNKLINEEVEEVEENDINIYDTKSLHNVITTLITEIKDLKLTVLEKL